MKAPLPVVDGVGPSYVVLPDAPPDLRWPRIIDFLRARFPEVGVEVWHSRMARAQLVDGRGVAVTADTPYRAGSFVYYYRELSAEPEIPFEAMLLHRDEHLLVVDKPHFLPVVPSGRFLHQTLLVRLKKQLGLDDLVPLHRLDRGTAGVVMFSINPATRGRYQSLFPRREIVKHYEALAPHLADLEFPRVHRSRMVEGTPFFRMREVAGTPNSETRIDLLERRGRLSLYRLNPITGKKHQLRVHMAALDAAIVNDDFYPEALPEAEDDFSRPLQLLARSLSFTDPLTQEPRYFQSKLALSS